MNTDPRIFELLISQVRDYAVFLLDPEGRIRTWNLGARLLKGYEPDEIIGRHFSAFYTQEAIDRKWPDEELRLALRQGRMEDEGWRVRKDGSRFWANVVITALREDDGTLLGFSKITRDLTGRRQHEESLRQSEERFRLLIDGVVDYALFMLDREGNVASWNPGAQRIKGYVREEILGRHFSAFYSEEDIAAGKPWAEIEEARRTGRAEDEGWRIRKSGEKFWARAVLTALYDSEGHLRGFAKVTQDLSQREHARALELVAQRLNEFVAMLAHELRNPLAPIRNALQVMKLLPPDDPRQESMLRTIDRQSGHLGRILDDLLDINRVTRGTLAVERRPLDLADAVERAVEMVQPDIHGSRHALAVDVPPGRFHVDGDVGRLTQLVANLLTNAARFTPSGGRIEVRARQEGDCVQLSVRDTGRGIPAAEIAGIFGMFVQGKEPIHRVGGGLGIGLALAKRVAELHGGTIEARSEGEGRGSEFVVTLPRREGAVPPEPVEPRPGRSATSRRILIVDDNIDAARSLEGLLQAIGHETRTVFDGAMALAAHDEFRPDVVLLDIGLPGMSGYDVARLMRERQGDKVRIIAVTGWGQEEDRLRSAEAGFDVHLVKPVDESKLREVLDDGGHSVH